jgi:hypothetical protein
VVAVRDMIGPMAGEEAGRPRRGGLDPETRRVAAAAVAGAAIGWWPAFTLGVYRVIFFEQHLALWAAATATFLAAGLVGGRRMWRRPAIWALLLPSFWLVLVWLLPVAGDSSLREVLFWFGIAVTLVGMPVLGALMVRLLIPEAERLSRSQALVVAGVVVSVMLVSYGLGTQHPHMLSCEDFTVSGNFAPENCTPGTGSTSP